MPALTHMHMHLTILLALARTTCFSLRQVAGWFSKVADHLYPDPDDMEVRQLRACPGIGPLPTGCL